MAKSVLVGENSENFTLRLTKPKPELGVTRFVLCDNFTVQTQVRENDQDFFLRDRSDGILRSVTVSVQNIIHDV